MKVFLKDLINAVRRADMLNNIIKIAIGMGLTIFLMRAMNYEVAYGAVDTGVLSVVSVLYAVLYLRLKRAPSEAKEPEAKKVVFTAEEFE
jgi:hypothetical protein